MRHTWTRFLTTGEWQRCFACGAARGFPAPTKRRCGRRCQECGAWFEIEERHTRLGSWLVEIRHYYRPIGTAKQATGKEGAR